MAAMKRELGIARFYAMKLDEVHLNELIDIIKRIL
jgi:hypothetical protein